MAAQTVLSLSNGLVEALPQLVSVVAGDL